MLQCVSAAEVPHSSSSSPDVARVVARRPLPRAGPTKLPACSSGPVQLPPDVLGDTLVGRASTAQPRSFAASSDPRPRASGPPCAPAGPRPPPSTRPLDSDRSINALAGVGHRPVQDKTECVRLDGPFKTVDELELATLSWVHWYKPTPAPHRPRLRPPRELPTRLLPSPPPAAAVGTTRCALNPGRFRTAVWAHLVGDEAFEAREHRMIERVLAGE